MAAKRGLRADDIGLLAKLVTAKPWWDTVDAVAANVMGPLCTEYPVRAFIAGHRLHPLSVREV